MGGGTGDKYTFKIRVKFPWFPLLKPEKVNYAFTIGFLLNPLFFYIKSRPQLSCSQVQLKCNRQIREDGEKG